MKCNILAIIQARMGSSRLPGKVLKLILGKPMLQLQLGRLQRSKKIDLLVVATSSSGEDDVIQQLCKDLHFLCFRGSKENVLDRFYQAALVYKPGHVVRLTGDCPLADPKLIDQVIDFHLMGRFDYTSNTVEPTFPDGLDVEIFRFTVLSKAWREAKLKAQQEHVTPFIYQQPDRFRIGSFKAAEDFSALRWTVDEPEDFELVRRIYEVLYPRNRNFTTADVLKLLKSHPELASVNKHFKRNKGYYEPLERDRNFYG